MSKKRLYGTRERVHLGEAGVKLDTSTWQPLDEGALSETHKDLFKARKAGVEAFLRGASGREIKGRNQ